MSKIKSNTAVAQTMATGLSNAASKISSSGAVSTDTSTTLAGNSSAHTAIDNEASFSSQSAGTLTTFISSIQQIASEFQALDTQLSEQIENSSTKVYPITNSAIPRGRSNQ